MQHTLTGTGFEFLMLALLIAGNGAGFAFIFYIVTRSTFDSILLARYQRRAALARLIRD